VAEYVENILLVSVSLVVAVAAIGLAGTGLLVAAQCHPTGRDRRPAA
jgi:hypothetical protein